ncbi:RNA polymerase factor sigma-54 [Candidatus Endobugula sertula]|uniref:RNA polymerase sigma-54 factor n=1 Tax=Candidatus Endobugula sertula TaxID=62101 RepID=A0A1D2QQS0_9GAMM|nr:RNA polymerase factor sigma-54 [Candidatus Endobugula sertula]
MKQSLQLKMGQNLTMTPQLQQAIRLLQLSTLDLQNEIQEALDSNPMLEIVEEHNKPNSKSEDSEHHSETHTSSDTSPANTQSSPSETATKEPTSTEDLDWSQNIPEDLPVDTNWEDVYQSSSNHNSTPPHDENNVETQRSSTESLQDHLLWQLNLTPFSDQDYSIALTIIDDIKPCGMLSSSVSEIYTSLKETFDDLEEGEVFAVLHRLQQFDPPGVASQNIEECLLIQLKQLEQYADNSNAINGLATAKKIAAEHLPLLATRNYKTLMRKLRIKENELKDAISLIQSTNPRPGEDIGSDRTEYVVPDVFVSKKNDCWSIELNPDIAPKIRINNQYAGLVKRADSSSDNTYLKNNLQEARWFLKSLQSRNETLLKVASAIVEKQRGFLEFGEEAMRPLILHDIAESVEMHESTISRVTTNKYMHTPQGIFELKYFFSSHVSTDNGGECSSTAIRAFIKKLIAAENVKKPLSDSKITTLLADQGVKVARRTIAKYRESMSIPPSNERKQLI